MNDRARNALISVANTVFPDTKNLPRIRKHYALQIGKFLIHNSSLGNTNSPSTLAFSNLHYVVYSFPMYVCQYFISSITILYNDQRKGINFLLSIKLVHVVSVIFNFPICYIGLQG